MKALIPVIFIILIASGTTFAQEDQAAATFTVFGGVALPSGDFGDDMDKNINLAETGYAAGIDFSFPIGTPEFDAVITALFFYIVLMTPN